LKEGASYLFKPEAENLVYRLLKQLRLKKRIEYFVQKGKSICPLGKKNQDLDLTEGR